MGVSTHDIFGDAAGAQPATPGSYGEAPRGYRFPEGTRLGRVRLQIADLARSLAYYEGTLGMRVLPRDGRARRSARSATTRHSSSSTSVRSRGRRRTVDASDSTTSPSCCRTAHRSDVLCNTWGRSTRAPERPIIWSASRCTSKVRTISASRSRTRGGGSGARAQGRGAHLDPHAIRAHSTESLGEDVQPSLRRVACARPWCLSRRPRTRRERPTPHDCLAGKNMTYWAMLGQADSVGERSRCHRSQR